VQEGVHPAQAFAARSRKRTDKGTAEARRGWLMLRARLNETVWCYLKELFQNGKNGRGGETT
jgi:hypothetical protein